MSEILNGKDTAPTPIIIPVAILSRQERADLQRMVTICDDNCRKQRLAGMGIAAAPAGTKLPPAPGGHRP